MRMAGYGKDKPYPVEDVELLQVAEKPVTEE